MYKSYVLKIAFYHKLFQDSKKHPLFSAFLGKLPTKYKSHVWKNSQPRYPISSMCTHHLTLWVVFPKSQHWPHFSNFQNPNPENLKTLTLAQIHYFSTFSIIFDNPFYFDCITQILFIGPKSQILEPYISIHTFTFIECLSFILHSLHSNY